MGTTPCISVQFSNVSPNAGTGGSKSYIAKSTHSGINYTRLHIEDAQNAAFYARAPKKMLQTTKFVKSLIVIAVLFAGATDTSAQSAENVAVIINEESPASRRIGEHYVRARAIPADNVIRISTSIEEQISALEYGRTIEGPIAQAITRHGSHDRILYLVLTKGVPLRIDGTPGRKGTTASVDSELTLLYRRMTGTAVAVVGPVPNPYFLGDRPILDARPFTHRQQDIFLVTRLDGFSEDDVIGLIDRAQRPAATGRIVLDQRSGGDAPGERWLSAAAARLKELGLADRVLLENTAAAARNQQDVLGYYSWGSNDPENRARRLGHRFVPGAIAATFMSTDARTFKTPPDAWAPAAEGANAASIFAGSSQALAGDLVREGVTGLAANVSEPYLDGAVRPEILFPAYLSGFNLVEAFYLASPYLSWQTIVLGDPLCAPLRKTALTVAEIADPVDPATELPALFSKRRLDAARLTMKGAPAAAVALSVRADVRAARGDKDGSRRALEEAATLAPGSVATQLHLALLDEQANAHAAAIERYRTVLKFEPQNVIALNNLAYSLAVRQKMPEEALPFARRALALAPDDVTVVDTVAWVEHLRANDVEASKLLTPFVVKGATTAEIHFHAAVIMAATGDRERAAAQLKQALQMDPRIASREDVQVLRRQLDIR